MTTSSGLFGSSELAAVDKCDRFYKLAFVDGLVRISPPEYRLLGSLIHVCLRYWYGSLRVGGPPDWFHARSMLDELDRAGQGHPHLIEKAKVVFARYLDVFANIDQAWRVLAVEERFTVPLAEIAHVGHIQLPSDGHLDIAGYGSLPIPIRPDVVVEREDGAQFLLDFKSTVGQWGKLSSWKDDGEYALAWQPLDYLFLGRLTRDAAGALRFPRLQAFVVQRIQTIEPWAMDRRPLSPTPHAYAEVPHNIVRQVRKAIALRARIAAGEHLLGSPWSCWGRGGACEFFDYCRSGCDPRVLDSNYKQESECEL